MIIFALAERSSCSNAIICNFFCNFCLEKWKSTLQCRFKTLLDSQISVPVSSQERYGIEINQSQGFARQLKCINCRRCKISTWVEIGFGFVLHCWHPQRVYFLCKSLSLNISDGNEYHQYFTTTNIFQPAGAVQRCRQFRCCYLHELGLEPFVQYL